MKKIILVIGLLGFLAVPTFLVRAVENPVTKPEPEIWLMSIELCVLFPPEVEDAVRRGILRLNRQCRWFAMGSHNPFKKDELAVWPTLTECEAAPITPPTGSMVRQRRCQQVQQ